MQKYTTVIEISSQWLKLVACKPSLKGLEIANLIIKPIVSLGNEDLSKDLNLLLKELKLTLSPLIVCFPRNLVTIRNLHLPSADAQEIDGMVNLHLPRQVPYPKEEIVSGYEILGIDPAGYTKVILAITHRDSLNRIFNILDAAGIFPEKVELSSQGVFAWFLLEQKLSGLSSPKDLYILLDIDYNFTDFIIASKDNLLFTRTIPQGSEQISTQEASRSKFIYELRQSLLNFQSEEANKKPSHIFITGAIEGIADLGNLVSNQLSLPVEIVETLKNIPIDKGYLEKIREIPKGLSLCGLIGLAFEPHKKRINFILPELQIRKTLRERTRQLIFQGAILMYLILIACGIFLEKMYNRQAYLRLLDRQLKLLSEDVSNLDDISRKIKIIKERLDTDASALNYLYHIHKLLPSEIIFQTITFEEQNKVVLRGEAVQMSDIPKFVNTLKDSPYFKDVETKFMSKKKVGDKDISEFEIICPLVK